MRFGLLGPLTLADEAGAAVPVDGARLRILLTALLLRANSAVSAEELAEAVWDREPPPGSARTLRSHVGRLRRLLGTEGDRVQARAPGYLIRVDPAELDLFEFERLCRAAGAARRDRSWNSAADAADEALRLWRGEPLADVPSQLLRDGVLPWLERLRAQLLEDRAEAGLFLGRHESLVADLRETVAAYPLRERLRGQLMLALYRSGRRAEALSAYQDARKVLSAELGAEPGQYLRGLHKRILADEVDDVAPAANGITEPEVSPMPVPIPITVPVTPRQLPAAAGCFTGRRDELDRIIGLLDAPRSADFPGAAIVISAIDGMAGVGKTALAVHAAYRLAEAFPDGQLFVDLHGYTQGFPPREPAAALGSLLQTLGVPAPQIPQDLEACAALYRHRLAGTRTLILLDNARDEAQVRPLLPGAPGCLVLVTSRRRLKGLHDAQVVALDVLPEQDALALLRTLISPADAAADDPTLTEIVELCGRLPLALRIVGALLRHRPAWTTRYLADLLRDEHRRLATLADGDHDLAAVLDLSYLGLGERHRLLLRHLALLPGPDLDAFTAAALLDTDPVVAAAHLEDLVDHSLLIAHLPGRYRLHDLVRAYAGTLSDADPESEHDDALNRLLHYYAYTAQLASVPIARYPRPGPTESAPPHAPALSDPDTARAWLRAERENLEAAHALARSLGLDCHAVALAAGMAEILRTDGPLTRSLDLQQAAAKTAERHGWAAAQARALGELGSVRQLTGDLPGAAHAETRALEIWRAVGDDAGEASALTELGKVWCLTGDYPGAAGLHARALEIYRRIGHELGEAAALAELGRVRLLTGDYLEAAEKSTLGLALFHKIGHHMGEADCLVGLGRVRLVMGELTGAGKALARALEIYRAIGHRHGQASALILWGNVRRLTGDLSGAAEAATLALEIHREIGHHHGQADALGDLGRVRVATGDLKGARDAFVRALEIYRTIGHRHGQGNVLIELGGVHRLNADLSGAAEAATLALEIYREIGHRHGEGSAMVELGRVQLAAGDPSGARDTIARALEIFSETGNRNGEAWALNFYAAAVAAGGDQPGARAVYQRARAVNRELDKPDDEALALEGLGECHLSLGETDAALDHLRQALARYERLGMAPDAERIRQRLSAYPRAAGS